MAAIMAADPVPVPAPVPPPFPIPLPAQWTSPLWWYTVIQFSLSQIVTMLTLFHVSIAAKLSGVTQGEIIMVAQGVAVVAFIVYGFIHHSQIKAAQAVNAAHYQAIAQMHFNEASLRFQALQGAGPADQAA